MFCRECGLKGDARALTPEIAEQIEEKMRNIVAGICQAHEVIGKVSFDTIFPATINSAIAARLPAMLQQAWQATGR